MNVTLYNNNYDSNKNTIIIINEHTVTIAHPNLETYIYFFYLLNTFFFNSQFKVKLLIKMQMSASLCQQLLVVSVMKWK